MKSISIFSLFLLLSLGTLAQSKVTPQNLINQASRVHNQTYDRAYRMSSTELEKAMHHLNQASLIIDGRSGDSDIKLSDIRCVSRKSIGGPYVLAYQDHDLNLIKLSGVSFTFEHSCKKALEKNIRRNNSIYFCSSASQNGSPYAVYQLGFFSRPNITKNRHRFSFEYECHSFLGIR